MGLHTVPECLQCPTVVPTLRVINVFHFSYSNDFVLAILSDLNFCIPNE